MSEENIRLVNLCTRDIVYERDSSSSFIPRHPTPIEIRQMSEATIITTSQFVTGTGEEKTEWTVANTFGVIPRLQIKFPKDLPPDTTIVVVDPVIAPLIPAWVASRRLSSIDNLPFAIFTIYVREDSDPTQFTTNLFALIWPADN